MMKPKKNCVGTYIILYFLYINDNKTNIRSTYAYLAYLLQTWTTMDEKFNLI